MSSFVVRWGAKPPPAPPAPGSQGYTYLTLAGARSILAARLQDSGLVYWTSAELNRYIVQAIREWQAFTASWQQRASFTANVNTPFYDLTSVLSPALLTYNVTDRDLISLILDYLLEPPLTSTWTGSGMFTFSAITTALQQRLNRFLGDTGIVVQRLLQAMTSPSVGRVFLPDTVLDVRRAAWLTDANFPSVLWRDDSFAFQAFAYNAPPMDPPQSYSVYALPPVGIQTFPQAANPGTLDLLTVQSGVTIGTTAAAVSTTPVVLNIPNDLAWAAMFGALSDLLSNDGPVRDPDRAQYAEQRYQEAVELTRLNPSVLLTQISAQPVWTGSVFELDAYMTSWQAVPGPPTVAALAGRNLMAVAPAADGVYGVTVDVVANIPVPAADGDYIQVDRGNVDAVIDEAQHLASFKMSGAEFHATSKLRQNFITAAGLENSRLRNTAFYRGIMHTTDQRQQSEVVRV